MNFSQYYDAHATECEWCTSATTVGAWRFAVYAVILDLMLKESIRLDDRHRDTVLCAYRKACPDEYFEAHASYMDYIYDR
jgi:hypothetical protein